MTKPKFRQCRVQVSVRRAHAENFYRVDQRARSPAQRERREMFRDGANMELRKAVQIAKEVAWTAPLVSGGVDEQRDAISNTESSDALAQLNDLVEEQRKRAPFMSTAQLFAQVYKANPELAAAERRQNRPR
jgi:hypothetical protein